MIENLIDVWDFNTFDPDLIDVLSREENLVRNYMRTDHEIFLRYDLGRGQQKPILRPENPYTASFLEFTESVVMELMQRRTIRAWHYTRLTDMEVERMLEEGVHLSTPGTLRARLHSLVRSGDVSADLADSLYEASPFHGQLVERAGRFWMTSHPVVSDDLGVSRLLRYWGGEVASFWTKAPELLNPLSRVGTSRVIELAVPVAFTQQCSSAAEAVVATFGRRIGCIPNKQAFDICATSSLPPASVIRVHSDGEQTFQSMGRGFPDSYVDVDIGRWKELTGEEG